MKTFTTVVFGYGFMANSSLRSLKKNKKFKITGVILPDKKSKIYSSTINSQSEIPTLYSDKTQKVYNFIKKLNPDFVIISTFNKILDSKTLKLSNFINIHHGKLPKQKGRASINWAIINGRNQIYITIHKVIAKLDAGPIIYQKKIDIKKNENYKDIKNKINFFLENHLANTIIKYSEKRIMVKKNNSKKETWNSGRNPEDGMINFYEKRKKIINLIRGISDRNFGAYCFLKQKKITVLEAKIASNKIYEGIIPGRIVKIHKNGDVDCLCSDGEIRLKKIVYNNKLIKPSKIINSTRFTLLND